MTHLLLIIIYIAFISLGLPDALLGSAWPSIYPEFSVPVSYAGIISMIIALGTVISSLNNYVALHYKSRHMSWLHCMWGIGASIGPYIMGFVLTAGMRWNSGYRIISILQIALTAALVLSLPFWKSPEGKEKTAPSEAPRKAMRFSEILSLPGAKAIMVSFDYFTSDDSDV